MNVLENVSEFSIGRWISILYRYRQNYLSKKLEPYNIGSGQYVFLLVLAKSNGINQEELSEYLKVDKGTTARAVKRLEKEGYITRVVDDGDKRAYRVWLTAKAFKLMPQIKAAVLDWEQQITSGLEKYESELIEQLLKKMALNACQLKN